MGLALIRGAMIAGEGQAIGGKRGNGLLPVALALVLSGLFVGRFLFYGLLARPGR